MRRAGVGDRRFRLVQPRPKARPRRSLRITLLLLLLAGTGLLLFKAADRYCRVEAISVTGNTRLSEDEVIRQSGIKEGTSLLSLGGGKAEKRLAALPEIRTAAVKKSFPSAVHISVREREEAASLLDQGCFWLVDSEGIPFVEQKHPEENLPVITGAVAGEISPGKPLGQAKKNEALCIFLEALARVPLLRPAELNLSDPAELVLYTEGGHRALLGGCEKMMDKLLLLDAYLQGGGRAGHLDLRTGDRLVVVSGR